jgi:hypothetical protein
MLGGVREQIDAILPLIRVLAPAPDKGWVYCGPSGAGHFVKMVHNGIEYGLMQLYAEDFSVLAAKQELELPLAKIAQAWCHGTVIRSWLLELIVGVLQDTASLDAAAPQIADSGEGRWTAQEAIDLGIPTPAINAALMARFSSQGRADIGGNVLFLPIPCVLSAHNIVTVQGSHGLRYLHLFIAHRIARVARWGFHREQTYNLQQVVRHDIADRPQFLVQTAAPLDSERFRHSELHARDVGAIPQRLQKRIDEAEVQKILHRFLAEEMIDAEDPRFVEYPRQNAIEGLRRFQVAARGFSTTTRAPRAHSESPSCVTASSNRLGGIAR